MKRFFFIIAIIAFAGIIFLPGCKKDSDSPGTAPTPSTNSAQTFSWTVNNNTVKADSGFFIHAFNNIVAYKGNTSVDIVLSSLSQGTYSISSATGNTLDYETGSTTQSAVSGTVSISTNANNQLSGSFSASFAGSTVTNISGQFTSIPGR